MTDPSLFSFDKAERIYTNPTQNIGLQAKILSTRTFTIFVVMALLTTFATTPLASVLYPPWYQKKLAAWKRGEIDWDTGAALPGNDGPEGDSSSGKSGNTRIRRLLVYLRLDNLPATLTFLSLFGLPPSSKPHTHPSEKAKQTASNESSLLGSADGMPAVRAHGMRLLQLTDRDSSVMTVSQVNEYSRFDPVVNIFRTVGQFYKVAVSGEVAVMPETRFAEALLSKTSHVSPDLLLVPWSETGSLGDAPVFEPELATEKLAPSYTNFVKSILQTTESNTAIFFPNHHKTTPTVGQGQERAKLIRAYSVSDVKHDVPVTPVTNRAHRIFLPYFGDSDDKLALMLVLQLCEQPDVTATVLRISDAEDEYFAFASKHLPAQVASRVKFESVSATTTIEEILEHASSEFQTESREANWYNLFVVGRRAEAKPAEGKVSHMVVQEIRECLGVAAGHFIASEMKADMLVVQSRASKTG